MGSLQMIKWFIIMLGSTVLFLFSSLVFTETVNYYKEAVQLEEIMKSASRQAMSLATDLKAVAEVAQTGTLPPNTSLYNPQVYYRQLESILISDLDKDANGMFASTTIDNYYNDSYVQIKSTGTTPMTINYKNEAGEDKLVRVDLDFSNPVYVTQKLKTSYEFKYITKMFGSAKKTSSQGGQGLQGGQGIPGQQASLSVDVEKVREQFVRVNFTNLSGNAADSEYAKNIQRFISENTRDSNINYSGDASVSASEPPLVIDETDNDGSVDQTDEGGGN